MYFKVNKDGIIIETTNYLNDKTGYIELPESDAIPGLDKIIDGKIVKATDAQREIYLNEMRSKTKEILASYEKEEIKRKKISALKAEFEKVKEDIEQVALFGITRSDTEQKRIRAAEIVNELRVLEAKAGQ